MTKDLAKINLPQEMCEFAIKMDRYYPRQTYFTLPFVTWLHIDATMCVHCALSISNWPLPTIKCKLGPRNSPSEAILQMARGWSGSPAGSRAGYELWDGITCFNYGGFGVFL